MKSMKKLAFPLIVVILLAALFPAMVAAAEPDRPQIAKLIAGKNLQVGEVWVWNDGEELHVKYRAFYNDLGYCLSETHMHVADSLAAIPQKNGNPIPGQFDYKDEDLDCARVVEYVVPLNDWTPGTELFIAAHAVVINKFDPDYEETAWGVLCGKIDVYGFPGKNWAAYIPYTVREFVSESASATYLQNAYSVVFLPRVVRSTVY